MSDDELLKKIAGYIGHDVEACRFIKAYIAYCHAIDDIVDEKMCSSEYITSVTSLASAVYTSNFWIKNAHQLYLVDALINNDWADSCLWEHSTIEWQKNIADVLRNTANNMVFATIFIVAGRGAVRDISLHFRAVNYKFNYPELFREVSV